MTEYSLTDSWGEMFLQKSEMLVNVHYTVALWYRDCCTLDTDSQCCGSGSGQSESGMSFIPNFSVKKSHFLNQIAQKMGIFSTYKYVHIKYVYIYV